MIGASLSLSFQVEHINERRMFSLPVRICKEGARTGVVSLLDDSELETWLLSTEGLQLWVAVPCTVPT